MPILGVVNPTLVSELDEFQPDCLLLYGHSYWSHFSAMRWARRNDVPYLLRCDSNLLSSSSRSPGLTGLKRRMLRKLAARSAGSLTIGQANDAFWAAHDLPMNRRFFAPMCVDGTKFAGAPKTRSSRSRAVISVGRFVHKKNFETLLAAWSPEFGQLLIVGGGLSREVSRSLRERGFRSLGFAARENWRTSTLKRTG